MSMLSARAALVSTVLVLGLAALSRMPYMPPGGEHGVLRLSWRMSLAARESCRPRSPAELEALPVHMRTPEVCTADTATYILVTGIDSAAPDSAPLTRGGVKGDRPLFVLEERTLAPGRHRVRVGLHRESESGLEALAAVDTVLTFEAGAVHLVTSDEQGRDLVVVSPSR